MKKPDLSGASASIIAYIEYQDKIINGASKLQAALSETKSVIANDLMLINKGETAGVFILNSDEKYFERINLMVKNEADWSKGLTKEQEKVEVKKKTNYQDFVLK